MKTVFEHMRKRLIDMAGVDLCATPETFGAKGDDLLAIADHQTNWIFLKGVVLKCVIGWYRYGDNKDPEGRRHDHIGRLKVEVEKYLSTGNVEHLEEIAVYAMLEATKAPLGRGTLPASKLHYRPIDAAEDDPTAHASELPK